MSAAMLAQWDRLICLEATRSFFKFQDHYRGALPYDVDDFIQCGREAVWKLPELPADADYKMSTYVINVVRWRCSDMVRTYAKVRTAGTNPMLWALPLDKAVNEGDARAPATTYLELVADPNAEQAFADVDNELAKQSVDLSGLSARDADIVRLRMDGLTYAQIATRFGISPARIAQIIGRLYKRLRRELGLS